MIIYNITVKINLCDGCVINVNIPTEIKAGLKFMPLKKAVKEVFIPALSLQKKKNGIA